MPHQFPPIVPAAPKASEGERGTSARIRRRRARLVRGFDGAAIEAMPVCLLEVVCDPMRQLTEIRNSLMAMYAIWRKDGGDFKDAVGSDAVIFATYLLSYKHPSFGEEQEIRAVHELRVELSDDGAQLIDEGGTVPGKKVDGEPVCFRASQSSIIAHVDIPLQRVDGKSICELWFGPSNRNEIGNTSYPLMRYGHRGIKLRRSASSYRV